MSHSHVEDGLLVSHYLAISNRQRVVASLQVKIFKCQLDHLDNGGDINETNEGSRCLNTPWTKCRGEISSHLWLPFPLFINPSYISFFLYLSIKLPAVYTVVVFYFIFFVIRIVFSFKSHTVWPNSSVLVFCFCKCLLRLLIMNCFSLIKYLIACQMVCTTFTLADHDSSFQMPSWAITRASLCIHIYMDICNPIGSIKATKRLCCNLVYKSFL